MVGEIRDLETAATAVQASLTGHLVMSTLHTNTAVGAVTRLADMGVETFHIATSLVGVLAQRLVRVLCTECREPALADALDCEFLGVDPARAPRIFRAKGCDACGRSGYRGQIGIYELIVVDDALRERIHDRASEQELTRLVRQKSPSIREDGRDKVLAGVTSVQEILRVTLDDA
jgi:general secretion pathway protein E